MATRTPKSNYHHGDLRRALIQAALELVAEQGADRLTLREVAQRVGVSHMAPYRHFENKSALLAALAQEGFQLLHAHLDAALAETIDPLHRLQAIGVAYVRYAVAHASHYCVMFDAAPGDRASFPDLHEAATATFGVLVQVLQEGQQAKMIRAGDAKAIAQVQWSLVHGLAMLIINRQIAAADANAVEKLAQFATQTAIDGLKIAKTIAKDEPI